MNSGRRESLRKAQERFRAKKKEVGKVNVQLYLDRKTLDRARFIRSLEVGRISYSEGQSISEYLAKKIKVYLDHTNNILEKPVSVQPEIIADLEVVFSNMRGELNSKLIRYRDCRGEPVFTFDDMDEILGDMEDKVLDVLYNY